MDYYRSGGISVDKDFARFGSKSYAINKINTVDVRERNPYGSLMLVIGGLCLLISILVCVTNFTGGSFVVALAFAGITYWGWLRSQTVVYDLYLKTSSSDVQAYESRDGNEVTKLRVAVEQAMIAR